MVATEGYPLVGVGGSFDSLERRERGLDARVSDARFRYLVPQGKPEDNLAPEWRDFWDPSQDELISSSPQSRAVGLGEAQRPLQGSARLPLAVEITLTIRQERQQGVRDLILHPSSSPCKSEGRYEWVPSVECRVSRTGDPPFETPQGRPGRPYT